MKINSAARIVDAVTDSEYEKYLYGCLFHSKRDRYGGRFSRRRDNFYHHRREYLRHAISKGFHKKILIFEGKQVGTIEYAPLEGAGLPIIGDNIIVMNCVWVQKKAQGHNFGKRLLEDMIESEKDASGFATIALENYWGPFFKKSEMEHLGFESLKAVRVRHKTKNRERCFKLHLMWLPSTEGSKPPTWNESTSRRRILLSRAFTVS